MSQEKTFKEMINRVTQGDCLELMKELPDGCVDLVVTDPPYGINFKSHNAMRGERKIVNDNSLLYKEFIGVVLPELYRVLKNGSACFVFGHWRSSPVLLPLLEQLFTVKGCIVWDKVSRGLGWHLSPQHEFIYLCHKGKVNKPIKTYTDIWKIPRVFCDKVHYTLHPHQKPIKLLSKIINIYPSDIILDPFAGSGTTLVAAKELGRQFIGFEIEQKYVDICNERLKQEVLCLK